MAENGAFLNDTVKSDGHSSTQQDVLSNGNASLIMDLEETKEQEHLVSTAKVAEPSHKLNMNESQHDDVIAGNATAPGTDVLIDFGANHTGSSEGSQPEMVSKPVNPPPGPNVGILDAFDPFQPTNLNSPPEGGAVPASAESSLFGMIEGARLDSSEIEVFAVPSPGPPEEAETEVEPEVAAGPEVTAGKASEMTSQSAFSPEQMPSHPSDGPEVTEPKAKSESKTNDRKTRSPATGNDVKEPVKKTDQAAKRTPRSLSASVRSEDNKSRKQPPKSLVPTSTSAKTSPKSPEPALSKSVAPPGESQRKTTRSVSSKGRVETPRGHLTHPKSKAESNAAEAMKSPSPKHRAASSTDPSLSKSPSPGSTPRSSVSASLDGKPGSARDVKSKIGSLENAKHTPGGGNVKIQSRKMDLSNVQSKCGSKDNATHVPGGGQKKIESRKLEWKVESKVGSMDNAKHRPSGGDKKIESKKLEWNVASRVGSMDNAQHKAGGGDKKIESKKLDWNVASKVGSLDNAQHKAGGGDKKIDNKKLEWSAASKVGSMDNAQHKPGGGDKKIETHRLNFNETATSKIRSLSESNDQTTGNEEPQPQVAQD